jgi:hypothetical protein
MIEVIDLVLTPNHCTDYRKSGESEYAMYHVKRRKRKPLDIEVTLPSSKTPQIS